MELSNYHLTIYVSTPKSGTKHLKMTTPKYGHMALLYLIDHFKFCVNVNI